MQPPQESESDWQIEKEFERSLADVEQALVTLKRRYTQVQGDRQRQVELQQRWERVNKSKRQNLPEMKAELERIQAELTALDDNLGLLSQSCLIMPLFGSVFILSKTGFSEVFWQIIRFAGLGMIVGWILKSYAG